MARGEQLGRQWRIIQTLIHSKRGKTAAELAGEIDCHPRTVYRDLQAVQEGGFPIYTERVEGKNLWSLLDTVRHQIPVPFSMSELMALYFSRDMMQVFEGTLFHDALKSLFKKVKTTLPPQSLEYLDEVRETLGLRIKPYKAYDKFREMIDRVNDAAIRKETVDIVYYTMSRKKETRRRLDPYRICFFSGTFYVIGLCHLRDEVRIFALDRIKMLHQTGEGFRLPDDFDYEEYMTPSFGIFQGRPVRVRVRFDADAAGYIREKVWHENQKITPEDDGSVLFEAEVAGTDEIRHWILSWGSKAEALEPESLREEIRIEALALARRYGAQADREATQLKA